MAESETHQHMKRVAASVLECLGYETQLEYDAGSTRVDVIGEKDGETVVVEVGELGNSRAEHIRENFSQLVHVPYDGLDENPGGGIHGDFRTNVMVNSDHWEELAIVAGSQGRSKIVRELIATYLHLCEEV